MRQRVSSRLYLDHVVAATRALDAKHVRAGICGLRNVLEGSTRYHLVGGERNGGVTLINVRGDDGTYFVWHGILDQSFTGVAQSGSEYWYCSHGKVDTSFNGSFQQDGYTYNVVNGKATLA
jgi:hypothetical protein